ncbi:MAG: hypothetical protein WD397_06755 [Wenzhouxiangellaceae bacterium]
MNVKPSATIEKNGTGMQMTEQCSTTIEKNGTGIAGRGLLKAMADGNSLRIRFLSSGIVMALAIGVSAVTMAQPGSEGYVLIENDQITLSLNNELFSSSGQAVVESGYSVIPLKIIDANHLDTRFDAMQPLSEGSGTGDSVDIEGSGTGGPSSEGSGTGKPTSEGSGTGGPSSEGSGTGKPTSEGSGTGRTTSEGSGTGEKQPSEGSGTGRTASEGSGTGKPPSEGSGTGRTSSEGSGTGRTTSEGSGTGRVGSEGSGTGQTESIVINVCLSSGRLGSAECDSTHFDSMRPAVMDGFAEIAIDGQTAFVLVYGTRSDGSLVELATLELPVIEQ